MSVPAPVRDRVPTLGFVVAIVCVGVTLRSGLTGVGSLLPAIAAGTGLSAAWCGVLTALPLLTFAAVSPLAARAVRVGPGRLLGPALAGVAAGLLLRSVPGVPLLFAGTVILSAAIAFANVLLPALVRAQVPGPRIVTATARYVTAMTAAAATASGIAVPLATVLPGGWRTSLACWAIPAVLAALIWSRHRRREPPAAVAPVRAPLPWRSALAWRVSLFTGLQMLGFYATIAWLPSILHDQGISARDSGFALFAFQILGLLAANAVPLLRTRATPRTLAISASLLDAAGFLLLACAPKLAAVSVLTIGIGAGICLVLSLSLQSEHAPDAPHAAALAAMSQSIGYLIAAIGPSLLGLLHTLTTTWPPALLLLTIATTLQATTVPRDR
ncbi:MFS transporter [Nocardia terpenica]|uniref:MFS transporter n=1 Tax=Nocardia terpenica TaxID=455432 RepID=UPI002FDF3A74